MKLAVGDIDLNSLLEKYNDFIRLKGYKVIYELADGTVIETEYDERSFLHLLGLHKLTDLALIRFWLDRSNKTVKLDDVIKKIKKEEFTDSDVRNSSFFSRIQERYENFSYDNLTTLNYTDAIIDFDASIVGSVLKGDYLLFEERPTGEYNHMSIARNSISGKRYVESFFHQTTDTYLKGQTIIKIVKFDIYDADGNVIVEDKF